MKEVTLILSILISCGFEHAMFAQSFTNIAIETGTDDVEDSWAAVWGDYDSDGDLDLYVSNWRRSNRLYRNDGDEVFQEVTISQGVYSAYYSSLGVSWADYDNDFDLDLFETIYMSPDRLYRNDGDIFTEVGEGSGFVYFNYSYSVAWGDYNNDGYLDLFVTDWEGTNQLFQNNHGYFTDVSDIIHITEVGNSRTATWGDYDNDGDLDLYVCRGSSYEDIHDLLYRNDTEYFTEVSTTVGITEIWCSLGADWGDFDNDGDLDLFVATIKSQPNKFYRNDDGIFADISSEKGVDNSQATSYSPAWVDYDNDGDLDLFVSRYAEYSNLMYQNENDTFSEVQNNIGLGDDAGRNTGISWGDFNNDGFLDVYLPNRFGQNYFYRNNGNSNHWLIISLLGVESNRNGIGARVIVFSGDLVQIREVSGGSGSCSQNSIPVEFGLGENSFIDSVVVRWPSGIVSTQTDISVDQFITVSEYDPPTIVANPSDIIDFGIGFSDFQISRDIDIRNAGNETLDIYSIVSDSPDFTILNSPDSTISLKTGEGYTVDIAFIATVAGDYSSNITITSNDPDNSVYTIALSGQQTGLLHPIADVTPDSLFERIFFEDTSFQILTISNLQGEGVYEFLIFRTLQLKS